MIREDKVEKAIEIIKYTSNLGYGIVIEGDTKKINEALDIAIDTMRKYQKIEQIVAKRGYFIDDKYFLIKEVVLENGNDNKQ